MINRELIINRIDLINQSTSRLKKLAELDLKRFTADPDNYAIGEHHLRRALESIFDIGRHIMAKKGLGYPADYRSILQALGKAKFYLSTSLTALWV